MKKIIPGKFFIISGPSQVGKDSIIHALWQDKSFNFVRILTNTTRAPRPGERDGKDYHFLTTKKFKQLINKNKLLEWAIVRQSYFGTSKNEILNTLKKGKNVLLTIDVQGAAQIKTKLPDTVFIFITAESKAEVKRRIFASSKMTPEQKNSRWHEAKQELKAAINYPYKVINAFGKINVTINLVKAIIKQELLKKSNKV